MTTAVARPKTFRFTTGLRWTGGRAATLDGGEGRAQFRIASPPEFRGETGTWSPEHLFVAAVDTCLLLTFAGLAEKKGLQLLSYESSAEGLLEWVGESFRFTSVTISPTIGVKTAHEAALARELLDRAHATCLVANSLRGAVVVEPVIDVAS